ncbi:hypothetical protein QR680_007891 [Steinernema hermaphroditum]|uniref:Uncharacterized protein n=1 Tax=Steinernema hermaphroditum TaxID=289476 RepID=A0AA39IG58_9BILA|nr:hypothetical protein QR680_007891 [Steinernema hermaphroditum]
MENEYPGNCGESTITSSFRENIELNILDPEDGLHLQQRSRTYCGTSIIYICFVDIQPIGFPYHGRMEKAIYAGDTLPRYHSSDVLCKFIALSSTLFTFVVVVAVPKLTASTDDLFRPSISKLSICATQILKMDFQSDFIFNIAAGLVMDAQHTERAKSFVLIGEAVTNQFLLN